MRRRRARESTCRRDPRTQLLRAKRAPGRLGRSPCATCVAACMSVHRLGGRRWTRRCRLQCYVCMSYGSCPQRARLQCMVMCRIGVVRCVSVALERGWRVRNVHGGGVPVRPSCLYIITTTCSCLGACKAVRDVVRARNSKNVRRRSTYGWAHSFGIRGSDRSADCSSFRP